MLERDFQKALIKELKSRYPGCMVLKNDPNYIKAIPDLTILYGPHWATLEVKKSADAAHVNNQDYYVEKMNEMSFSAFIFPENKEEVLNELDRFFTRAIFPKSAGVAKIYRRTIDRRLQKQVQT